jgi:hypothetical protein
MTFQERIEALQKISPDDPHLPAHFSDAVSLCQELKGELDSLWGMMDEMKASEIEAHATNLKRELDRKIGETLSLVRGKIVQA